MTCYSGFACNFTVAILALVAATPNLGTTFLMTCLPALPASSFLTNAESPRVVVVGLGIVLSALLTAATIWGGCCFGLGRYTKSCQFGTSRQVTLASGWQVTVHGAQ